MKLFLYLCLLSACCAKAQSGYYEPTAAETKQRAFGQRSWQVGVQGGYSQGNLLRNYASGQLYAGYFLADKFMIGLAGILTREWVDDLDQQRIGIGPVVRYQATRSRVSPFLEVSYQIGRQSINFGSAPGRSVNTVHSGSVTPGLSLRVLSSLRADLSYRFQRDGRYMNQFQPQVGLNYAVARKRSGRTNRPY